MGYHQEIQPPLRTIMTPGPVEADPRVLRAMSTPVVGQFDPAFTSIMNETMELLRCIFQTENEWAFPVDGTSRSGIEAVLASAIHPGDRVLVPIYGRFGYLLTEIAERYGAEIHTLEKEWGTVFSPEEVIEEMDRVQPDIVAMVHGETSTGCIQPLKEIGHACRARGIYIVVDAVATIGGVPVKTDEWCLDAVIGGTQKCFSVPSGMAPLTYNERLERRFQERKKVERGIATEADKQPEAPMIRSNYFDLSQLQDYWGPRRLNHHTEATSMVYALHEGARLIVNEGLESRFARHRYHEEALTAGLKAMGLSLFVEGETKLPVVTCINVPEGIDADEVRKMLLGQFGIEIASSFGPLHGKIWRIGSMGYSCRKENVLAVLGALESVLLYAGAPVNPGTSQQAALSFYMQEKDTKAAAEV
ncbi:(S)-ureidoglycine-glyoxylate aminotransferase [Marinococcus luteus]|uniref:(S)-ureidoglycine-glyoxylate aminotransferase n=1 Tax=Marinococcus luteus TaxID=1122204 RepID=A0A1H2WK57_9BACI|nr:alanine--glyoxylate aminotransferase family protein [Marinococcus luteus]SDW81043.1 (S)-ureidoglycine-glyoxylate aminotransferase [Marinococcus luteus]